MWLLRNRTSYFTANVCTTCSANSRAFRSASAREEYKNQSPPASNASRIIQIPNPPSPLQWELRENFILKTEPGSFDHLTVVDQYGFSLLSGIGPESVSGVQVEFHKITKERLPVFLFRHRARLGAVNPLDLRARPVDKHRLKPVVNDLLVILGILSVKRGVGADLHHSGLCGQGAHCAEREHNQERDRFHLGRD